MRSFGPVSQRLSVILFGRPEPIFLTSPIALRTFRTSAAQSEGDGTHFQNHPRFRGVYDWGRTWVLDAGQHGRIPLGLVL